MNLKQLFIFGLSIPVVLAGQIQNPDKLKYNWKTDTSKHEVPLSDLTLTTPRDVIPTLSYPGFIKRTDPLNKYFEYEPVIAIQQNGSAKAYPLSILTMYELANDSFGGQELMITFCPMCHAAIVFNRQVDVNGNKLLLNFGISGILMHNDMVMYDRETETWWEQLMGTAIVGALSGTTLEFMPSMLISVKDYFDRYPNGEILSPEGIKIAKHHRHKPFHHLEHDSEKMSKTFFLPEKTDPRLPPLEHVVDIHIQDHTTIYPYSAIAAKGVINDAYNGQHFVIFYHGETVSVLDEDKLSKSKHIGSATAFRSNLDGMNLTFKKSGDYFIDEQTGSRWDITGFCREGEKKGKQLWLMPHSNHFAFAYLAFYPESEIYDKR